MNWTTITLRQYQQIHPVLIDETLTEMDKAVRVLAVLLDIDENEIDSWSLDKLKQYRNDIAFLFKDELPSKTPKHISVNGRRYRFVWEINKMPAARYIEAKTYSQDDLIANLHKVMASCVMPQERNWFGRWVDAKYNAADHPKYSADMMDAKFVDVHNCVVFFYHVFANWMLASKDYLIKELSAIMTKDQATALINTMAGFTQLHRSQITSE